MAEIIIGSLRKQVADQTETSELADLLGVDTEIRVIDTESGEVVEGELNSNGRYRVLPVRRGA